MHMEKKNLIIKEIESKFRVDALGAEILSLLLMSHCPLTKEEIKTSVNDDNGFMIEMMSLKTFGYITEVPTLFDKDPHYTVSAKVSTPLSVIVDSMTSPCVVSDQTEDLFLLV